MAWILDLVLSLILVGNSLGGLRKGLVLQIFSILGIVAGIALGLTYTDRLLPLLAFLPNDILAVKRALIFLALFVITVVVANIVGITLRTMLRAFLLGPLDRLGGAVLAFVETWLLIGGVFAFLLRHNLWPGVVQQSLIGTLAARHMETLLQLLGF